MNRILPFFLLISVFLSQAKPQSTWGKLANPEYENEAIKSIFFFSGNWRNGVQFYDYNPSNNTGLYTIHPSDARNLGWSESQANRDFVIEEMILRGFNVINISYWGLPGTDNWAHWAPMQTSTVSHDELFEATLDKDILIAPYIESFASTDDYPEFIFRNDFPGTANNPAPNLIAILEDLIDRYIIHPENIRWPEKWAKVYDQDGTERYLFSIIHVASDQSGVTNQSFAIGFDSVANVVYRNTGVKIGFAIDALPRGATYSPGVFKPKPETTGPYLAAQKSMLAVQCFIPEIWNGISDIDSLLTWKKQFTSRWISTGIPVILDVSPGYDANILFPTSPVYGNNYAWRNGQEILISELDESGLTFNAWNGYTEGLVAVPSLEYGDSTYRWICDVFHEGNCNPPPAATPITENTNQEPNDEHMKCYFSSWENQLVVEFINPTNFCEIDIYDFFGRLVESYSTITIPGEKYRILLNSDYTKENIGFYICRLSSGNRSIGSCFIHNIN